MMNNLDQKINELQHVIERNMHEKEILEKEYDNLMQELKKTKEAENILFTIAVIFLSILIGIVLCCYVK